MLLSQRPFPGTSGGWLVQLASGASGSRDTHSAGAWRVQMVTAGICVCSRLGRPGVGFPQEQLSGHYGHHLGIR